MAPTVEGEVILSKRRRNSGEKLLHALIRRRRVTTLGWPVCFTVGGFSRSEVGVTCGGARVVNGGAETSDVVRADCSLSFSFYGH